MAPDASSWKHLIRLRVRLVGRAAGVGIVVGTGAFLAVLTFGDAAFASRKSFAVGSLLFGFGLLGWGGSVMVGSGFEAMRSHLGAGTEWTEMRSRRAMARIGGFGAGWMVGTVGATTLLG